VGRPLACSTRGDDVPWQFAGTTQCLEEYVRGGYQLSGSPGTSGSAEIPSARLQCRGVRCKPIAGPQDRPSQARRPYQTTQHPPPQHKSTVCRLGRPWRHFYWAIMSPGLKTGRNGRVWKGGAGKDTKHGPQGPANQQTSCQLTRHTSPATCSTPAPQKNHFTALPDTPKPPIAPRPLLGWNSTHFRPQNHPKHERRPYQTTQHPSPEHTHTRTRARPLSLRPTTTPAAHNISIKYV